MNNEVRKLQPIAVWNKFADLNAVPRPSKKEEKVIQFMLDFGTSLGLETFKDAIGNVIIRKPATVGMENRKTITLQSHLDMVHQKNASTVFDFDKEGIQMFIEDDWVKAKGTTLGADNGMGVATIMALLESKDIVHPSLEALFTVDEETGMTGAMELAPSVLKGDILLNLDTEEDDEIGIGCAGGVDITAIKTYNEKPVRGSVKAFEIVIKGLQGGHSGVDIHKGLGNANKIMNRLLYLCSERYNIRIFSIEGGSLRNAIPRESFAKVIVDKAHVDLFKSALETWFTVIKDELAITEPSLSISITKINKPKTVMGIGAQDKLLKVLYTIHNGVYAMSASVEGLVETSNNVAIVVVKDGAIEIQCLTRSSVDSAKLDLANSIKSAFELAGFDITIDGSYPGWNPNPNSPILKVLKTQYKEMFKEEPRVIACHAGLECGILGQNYPEMDMISFGPTIKGAHSPDERVSIKSVQKFWKYTLAILKNSPLR